MCKVNCAVTGSSEGAVNDPKCPLLPTFRDSVFKKIEKMTAPGAKCFGCKVIIQGDNAGPHQDATFLNGVKEHCELKGDWCWEPQAAQMSHMNVLDLSAFTCMSCRHTEKCRDSQGSKVLQEDEIWENAVNVWNELPNWKIASAYIQAYRIAGKVIKAKGNNNFIGSGGDGIHCHVNSDFKPTCDGGLARKDGKVIEPPNN